MGEVEEEEVPDLSRRASRTYTGQTGRRPSYQLNGQNEWVVLDITNYDPCTNKADMLKMLQARKVTVCEITEPFMKDSKQTIAITVDRMEFYTKRDPAVILGELAIPGKSATLRYRLNFSPIMAP
jgi:hypothetical protein